jgi:hypothetical protein
MADKKIHESSTEIRKLTTDQEGNQTTFCCLGILNDWLGTLMDKET